MGRTVYKNCILFSQWQRQKELFFVEEDWHSCTYLAYTDKWWVLKPSKKTFSTPDKWRNHTILIPESAFALNYFSNDALCKLEMSFFSFSKCCILKKSLCKIEDLFVRFKRKKREKMNSRLGVKLYVGSCQGRPYYFAMCLWSCTTSRQHCML